MYKRQAWGSGRVPVGINTSDTNFSTVEKTGGSATVTLTASQMPSHTHTFTGSSATTSSNGAHTHTLNLNKTAWSGSGGSRVVVDSTDYTALTNNKTSSNGAHTHTVTAKGTNANTGGGGSHTNLQPYIVCYTVSYTHLLMNRGMRLIARCIMVRVWNL